MAWPEVVVVAAAVPELAPEQVPVPVPEPARELAAVANSSRIPDSLDSRYHRNP